MCNSNRDKHHHDKSGCGHNDYNCSHSHGRMQKFIEPCLLLLLAQESTYGYDLINKLDKYGFDSPDPGTVYRYLRDLEDREMVSSNWNTDSSGPAKRSYQVTPEGEEYLQAWVAQIKKNKEILGLFLDEFKSLTEK